MLPSAPGQIQPVASGQGRWQEELDFPVDCRRSHFTPVLVCMDGTPNPKLSALAAAFLKQKGEVYVGDKAWAHRESHAGKTMSAFLERYVRGPIQKLLGEAEKPLLDFTAKLRPEMIEIGIGSETLRIDRHVDPSFTVASDAMPADADDVIPGS